MGEYSHWSEVTYYCETCIVTIEGKSGDPQEAPILYCPRCGDKLSMDVDW